jgi:hypothetical protein
MTATETARRATHATHPLTGWDGLRLDREDIAFSSPAPGLLAVELTIHNDGDARTSRTLGLLQSAPLGAFVPWQPLDAFQVPPLEPGESAVVTKEYAVPTPQVLGGADKLPPDRLLVALGLGEPDRRRPAANPNPAPGVATDVLALIGQGSVHWAGNLNVFVSTRDVERHVAKALRVYPGYVNLAVFVVGSPSRADEYRFGLSGDAVAWNARIFNSLKGHPWVAGAQTTALKEGEWVPATTGVFLLSVQPTAKAERGAVSVHVCQRSSGREAVVEFTLDAHAAGPGCYKI